MAAITGPIPGIPRWVGATAELVSEHRDGKVLACTVVPRIPRVRGLLYGAWLHLTGKARRQEAARFYRQMVKGRS